VGRHGEWLTGGGYRPAFDHPAQRARGKTANVVNVAIAREMVGFIWSIACTVQAAPKAA
jgi:hypothetical protein